MSAVKKRRVSLVTFRCPRCLRSEQVAKGTRRVRCLPCGTFKRKARR